MIDSETMKGLRAWAAAKSYEEIVDALAMLPGVTDPSSVARFLKMTNPDVSGAPAGITVDELLENPDLLPEQREWLESYREGGTEWAEANNPPGFVTNEACWEKAKRAAEHAGSDDIYAFANWFYNEHCT